MYVLAVEYMKRCIKGVSIISKRCIVDSTKRWVRILRVIMVEIHKDCDISFYLREEISVFMIRYKCLKGRLSESFIGILYPLRIEFVILFEEKLTQCFHNQTKFAIKLERNKSSIIFTRFFNNSKVDMKQHFHGKHSTLSLGNIYF